MIPTTLRTNYFPTRSTIMLFADERKPSRTNGAIRSMTHRHPFLRTRKLEQTQTLRINELSDVGTSDGRDVGHFGRQPRGQSTFVVPNRHGNHFNDFIFTRHHLFKGMQHECFRTNQLMGFFKALQFRQINRFGQTIPNSLTFLVDEFIHSLSEKCESCEFTRCRRRRNLPRRRRNHDAWQSRVIRI